MRIDIHTAEVPVLCRACEARHQGICGVLSPVQLLHLGRQATRREVAHGTELVAAGPSPEGCANILSGVVKLTRLLPDGRRQIVGLQFAPDFLGQPFSAESDVAAEAAGTVRLCTFPRTAIDRLVKANPDMQHRLHRQALRELDEARNWMTTLGQKSAAERVASFLLLLGRHLDPETDGCAQRFEIPLTRADMADFLGLTIETVSRQISRLRRAGTIAVERHRLVTILDAGALVAGAGD